MSATQATTRELGANSITRDDVDTSTTTKALITKVVAGTGNTLSSTGVDAGTGDVTINVYPTVQTAKTVDYTLVLTDAGTEIPMDKATAINLTVPLNSSVAFPLGTQIAVPQINVGQVTVVATGGVTINVPPNAALKARGQYSYLILTKRLSDTWDLTGDLEFTDNVIYKTLLIAAGSHIAAKVAGTYAVPMGDPLAISGTGTLYPIATLYILSTEYSTTAKFRVNVQLYVNDVAPTGNFTFGLYPITRPATSGGAGLNIYTLGTVIVNSTVLFTTPAADSANSSSSAEFTIPADGHYCIGVITTATVATSSHLHIMAKLQVK